MESRGFWFLLDKDSGRFWWRIPEINEDSERFRKIMAGDVSVGILKENAKPRLKSVCIINKLIISNSDDLICHTFFKLATSRHMAHLAYALHAHGSIKGVYLLGVARRCNCLQIR